MNYDFKNKAAIITGAASGIGLATARAFAEAGASVAMADINEGAVNTAAEELSEAGYPVLAIRCDVTDELSVKAMIDKTVEKFGRLDFAYNNVGKHAPVSETADAEGKDFDDVIATNLRGVWSCMKYELQVMRQQKSGVIVNASSQSGLVGTANIGAYTASKWGVIGLTKCVALEYAKLGIRVNAICPGTTDTAMVQRAFADKAEHMQALIDVIPVGRMGKPEETASLVLYLCSPGAAFLTGQAIAIDGGYTVA